MERNYHLRLCGPAQLSEFVSKVCPSSHEILRHVVREKHPLPCAQPCSPGGAMPPGCAQLAWPTVRQAERTTLPPCGRLCSQPLLPACRQLQCLSPGCSDGLDGWLVPGAKSAGEGSSLALDHTFARGSIAPLSFQLLLSG